MHNYKVQVFFKNEDGSVGAQQGVYYYDNVESAKNAFEAYSSQTNEDGTTMYQVRLHVLAYKLIDSPYSLFNMFKA